jgi:hypothetical protein
MIPISITTKQFRIFILRGAHCVALCALIALAAVLVVAASAVAEQGFALIGSWENTARATQNSPAFTQMWTFRPDGTCAYEYATAYGQGSGTTQMQCRYRPTGASSLVVQVKAYRLCTGGMCNSCPLRAGEMPGNACYAAQTQGMTPGTQWQASVRMQGPNQYVDQNGITFRRVR